MPRTISTEKRWLLLLQLMKTTCRVYNKPEHRMIFERILYRRFNLWFQKGILNLLFNGLSNKDMLT